MQLKQMFATAVYSYSSNLVSRAFSAPKPGKRPWGRGCYSSSFFSALFELTKPDILECRALQRGCFGKWSMASLLWAVGGEFQRARTEKNAQGSRLVQVASSSLTVCTFSKRFCIKKWPISFDLL